LSRCQVYVLENLSEQDLIALLQRAIKEDPFLKQDNIQLQEHEAILRLSGGDARKLLSIFELVVDAAVPLGSVITNDCVLKQVRQNMARYDKIGERRYDIISAFIKSIRGSDPTAAVYSLARMFEGGEHPSFFARRLLIWASEDIGS